MIARYSFIAVFFAGVASGWFGKSWFDPMQLELPDRYMDSAISGSNGSPNSARTHEGIPVSNSVVRSIPQVNSGLHLPYETEFSAGRTSGISGLEAFKRLLSDRRYNDAMVLYQELIQQSGESAGRFKRVLLDQLQLLSETRNNSDFSELIESYLSVYYDDVDVLLMLADFNQANGSYFEVVDVYLLAKTYAYTEADQKNMLSGFNDFVEEIDNSYTNQKKWLALINLYSHIDTSGLMTSPYQYRQALAHYRSGDEQFAIEQFTLLQYDSLVGEYAATALNNLSGISEAPVVATKSIWEGAESIALQKLGNQYVVHLTGRRQVIVKLLIDTGASMTTLSRASFDALNSDGDAVELDRRVFRTASGVIMGTVYSIPELTLGSYILNNTEIAVLDFQGEGDIDGLLGMNILGQFRFQIDQEINRLLLSKSQ